MRQATNRMNSPRLFGLLAGLALIIVLAISAQSGTDRLSSDLVDVRAPALNADDPLHRHLLWAIGVVNGAEVTSSDIEQRLAPEFLEAVPAEEFLTIAERDVVPGGPYVLRGIEQLDEKTSAVLMDGEVNITVVVGYSLDNPDQIDLLQILPANVDDDGPFSNATFLFHLAGGLALCVAALSGFAPYRRTLLAMAGVLWLAQLLELGDNRVLYTLGLVAGPWALAIIGHVLVRVMPPDRFDIALIGAAYLAAGIATTHLLYLDTSVWGLPDQLLSVRHDGVLVDDLAVIGALVGAAVAIAISGRMVGALVVRRRGGVSGLRQDSTLPAVVAAVVVAATLLGLAISRLGTDHYDLSQSAGLSAAILAVVIAVAYGAVQRRYALGGVAVMVADLGQGPVPNLRGSLADALGDPTVEIAYFSEQRGGYVSADGTDVVLPDGDGRAVTLLESGTEQLGAVIHDPALLAEPQRVQAACAAVRLALHNERLQAAVASQLAEVQASRARIAESAEQARQQIERDLHDGAQQRLLGLQLAAKLEHGRVAGSDPQLDRWFEQLGSELSDTVNELRELGRGLHPSALDRGLVAAVESMAERSPIPVVVSAEAVSPPRAVEAAAYFVISEAVTNAARHSKADHVNVDLRQRDGVLTVEVRDDGVGGAQSSDLESGGLQSDGPGGLRNMRDRVEAMGGAFAVGDGPAGGTVVRAELPCES